MFVGFYFYFHNNILKPIIITMETKQWNVYPNYHVVYITICQTAVDYDRK